MEDQCNRKKDSELYFAREVKKLTLEMPKEVIIDIP